MPMDCMWISAVNYVALRRRQLTVEGAFKSFIGVFQLCLMCIQNFL